jgi:hypothetical protein
MNIGVNTKNKKIIGIAIWIKEFAHAFRVFGGIFFVLALVTGIFWIAGNNVEPIAYVLGLISSLLFASPSIAEYVVPNRKPVRHMDYDEILEFVKTTNAKTDWKWVKTNWAEEAFLKEDPRLRIRVRWDDEGIHVRGFQESWANKHPDPTANSYWYDLSYDGALIDRFILVSVDGARAELPLPDRNTLEVEPLIYKIAQIFDGLNTLDEYMRRSGLSVKNKR